MSNYGGDIFCCESSPEITNCILWGGTAQYGPEIALYDSSLATVTYSDVEGGEATAYVQFNSFLAWGEGNIDADPLFVGGGDYHLTASSPCIDAGAYAGAPTTDIDGDTRPDGAGCDMGADEYAFPDLTLINLQSPANGSVRALPPTFTWTADGGTNNEFTLDLLIGAKKVSIRLSDTSYAMPPPKWALVPPGTEIRWGVRGVDLDDLPPTIIRSAEKWSFHKQ